MRSRLTWGAFVLSVLLAGCTPSPVAVPQPPPAPPAQVQVAAPTPAPVLPTAQPAPAAPPAPPTSQPTAVPVAGAAAPTVAPTPARALDAPVDANPCDGGAPAGPLPAPGSSGAQDFFRSFRMPLAPAALYNPPGPKRIGLQAGHWLNEQVPPELGRLQQGSSGGGKAEWEVNLDVAQRTAALLRADGFEVDVLPATIPPRYRANVFLALHADGDPAGVARGFKVARPGFSSVPAVDDKLVDTLNNVYAGATDLPRDDEHISLRMRYYYAFNSRRYCHAVAPGVPQAIVEMGYLTSSVDRQWLIGNPERVARGLAHGISAFVNTVP